MAFDAGLFSFRDITLNKNVTASSIFTLITNPKDLASKNRHDPWYKLKRSTHIRLLVFSKLSIKSVHVYLDSKLLGQAKRHPINKTLFLLEWNPDEYAKGIHQIHVVVEDIEKNKDTTGHEFAIDDSFKSFSLLANLLLLSDQTIFVIFKHHYSFSFNFTFTFIFRLNLFILFW